MALRGSVLAARALNKEEQLTRLTDDCLLRCPEQMIRRRRTGCPNSRSVTLKDLAKRVERRRGVGGGIGALHPEDQQKVSNHQDKSTSIMPSVILM